jgi:hypothetical protein
MKDMPYKPGEKLTVDIYPGTFFCLPTGDTFEAEVISAPKPKAFRIREVWGASLTYVAAQVEGIQFEIQHVESGVSRYYWYRGLGLTLPIPNIPKVAGKFQPSNIPGAASGVGPWNDFIAPGYYTLESFGGDAQLQTPYSAGLGSSISMNIFSFGGGVDNRIGYPFQIKLNTGRTYGLPSSAFSNGKMEIIERRKAARPR